MSKINVAKFFNICQKRMDETIMAELPIDTNQWQEHLDVWHVRQERALRQVFHYATAEGYEFPYPPREESRAVFLPWNKGSIHGELYFDGKEITSHS